jgi:hypothetical protein
MIVVSSLVLFASQAFAWHNNTHLAIAKAAGFTMWHHCAGPDIAKIKADTIESYNHWFNNTAEVEVTPQTVLDQAEQYNKNMDNDAEGHLLGAIIASLRAYEKDLRSDKYALYNLVYCAHYISDLSMPLHNIAFDDFNKEHHDANDGIVEENILEKKKAIEKQMYTITLRKKYFEDDLGRHIARIANLSRKLGYKLRAENRNMTRQEAYVQLGHSASLLKAILNRYNKTTTSERKAVQ